MTHLVPSTDGGQLQPPLRLPTGPAQGSDARGAERYTVLLRTAKLIADGAEYLCVLRDISATGVKLRLFHRLPDGDMELELTDGQRYVIEPMWCDGEHAGFRFARPVDVRALIESGNDPYNRRKVRLNVSKQAEISVRGSHFPVKLTNLSAHGAGIISEVPLMQYEQVRLEVEKMPLLYAKVCWCRAPRYGLVFDFGFRLEQLAGHVATLQGLAEG